ncbi:ATP-binding protein [Streptomyces tubbatahanensis]|uniref:ATP-binding protein n=1 Tax=Streptomyces tubbatahanensis TaxID=2923272 RepID=A0ABY3XMY0_9ACTN|nr:ATP-binding protein [Streptomyces tubbatahanensis]UNS95803.1 ATP-binding protein [Streptomyces tubbatahanensis]
MALWEREAELAAIEAQLTRLCASSPSACDDDRARVLALTGATGLGKTALLYETAARASARGCTVVYARGSEQEQESGFHVLRALWEPVLPLLDAHAPDDRSHLAAAAVGLSAPACAVGPPPHAVYRAIDQLLARLAAHLAARAAPLVVLVDDVHWADPASLAWLTRFLPRAPTLPLLCVLAYDPREARPELAELPNAAGGAPQHHALDALSAHAVDALVRAAFEGASEEPLFGGDTSFAQECRTLTAGNPLAVTRLLDRAGEAGLKPHRDSLPRLAELAPTVCGPGFHDHLQGFGPDCVRLCWAVAVLGAAATLPLATRVAGLGARAARRAADTLRRAQVLDMPPRTPDGTPPADEEAVCFTHPSFAGEVYRAIPSGLRTALHGQTAATLALTRPGHLASAHHLLEVHPDADPTVVAELRRAARAYARAGAPEAAHRCLGRALSEPPARQDRPLLLYELASAALRSGAPAGAVHHLRAALAEPDCDAPVRSRATRLLALAERRSADR